MPTRREMIAKSLSGITGLMLLPTVNSFASIHNRYTRVPNKKLLFRFALASDIHYAQEGTEYAEASSNLIKWLNEDHAKNHLDMIIINGDLVHNRPDLLPELKSKYLDHFSVPYLTIPGNHDFADAPLWNKVFGYPDRYTKDLGEVAFILANTADTKGNYICPDYDFLKSSLEQFKSKRTVFVVLHIAPVIWTKTDPFVDCPEIIRLLHAYPNVKAAFHGHDHLLDGVRYTDRLPHFFDSHIGSNWGTDYKGYRIVEVADDHSIYTYQVNASQNPVLNSNRLR